MTAASTVTAPCVPSADAAPGLCAESFATGVTFLLGLNVVQKLVGLIRSVLFCGLLADAQLGRWSLAYGFLVLAAPLAVLGLPGSFGRYVEYYRQRGQLGGFLRRTTTACAGLGAIVVLLVLLVPEPFAWLVFKDPRQTHLIRMLGVALAITIVFNFLTELSTALRQVRLASMVQFINSLVFAGLGFGLLYFTAWKEDAVVLAYSGAGLAGIVVAVFFLRHTWHASATPAPRLSHRDLWGKLLPFALWVWVTNLMANSFDTADRLMIVHFAGVAAEAANALVGQYHCSRVVPILMFQAAATLGAILLPHLCHDWEAGRHDAVSRRLNGCLKLTAWAFTATAIVVLLAAPLLFGWVLQGRYDQGLSVLPWTLTYCLWFSLVAVAQNYLWCAERAWLSSLALLFGLLVNVTLNFLLLPRWGLLGVVLASNAANAVTLVLVYRFSQRSGMTIERGTWLASGLPVLLSLGPWRAAVALLLVAWLAIRGNAFFCSQEKQRFFSVLRRPLGSLRLTLTEGSV